MHKRWVERVEQLLVDRGWPELGAEAAADQVATFYYEGTTPWTIRRVEPPQPGMFAVYLVARGGDRAVYDTRSELRAADIADVLNQIEAA